MQFTVAVTTIFVLALCSVVNGEYRLTHGLWEHSRPGLIDVRMSDPDPDDADAYHLSFHFASLELLG